MSIHVMNQVWKNAPCQGNTLLALLALADWSDDDGRSWPSMITLAKKSRQSERNCRTVVRELESLKIIEVKEREGTSSMFTINLEMLGGQSLPPAKISKRGGLRRKSLPETAEMFAPYTSIETSQDQKHTSTLDFPETEDQPQKEPKGKTKVKNPATDPRHDTVRRDIISYYNHCNNHDPAWGGREARMLKTWLDAHKSWSAAEICSCINNRFMSEVNLSEEPFMWIGMLAKYKAGPLNKFGQPKGTENVRSKTEQRDLKNGINILRGTGLLGRDNRPVPQGRGEDAFPALPVLPAGDDGDDDRDMG